MACPLGCMVQVLSLVGLGLVLAWDPAADRITWLALAIIRFHPVCVCVCVCVARQVNEHTRRWKLTLTARGQAASAWRIGEKETRRHACRSISGARHGRRSRTVVCSQWYLKWRTKDGWIPIEFSPLGLEKVVCPPHRSGGAGWRLELEVRGGEERGEGGKGGRWEGGMRCGRGRYMATRAGTGVLARTCPFLHTVQSMSETAPSCPPALSSVTPIRTNNTPTLDVCLCHQASVAFSETLRLSDSQTGHETTLPLGFPAYMWTACSWPTRCRPHQPSGYVYKYISRLALMRGTGTGTTRANHTVPSCFPPPPHRSDLDLIVQGTAWNVYTF